MLNSFLDKYIFTNTLKYTHNNFFLVDMPFVITPISVLTNLAGNPDSNLQKKIYAEVKRSSREHFLEKVSGFGLDKEKQLKFVQDFFVASGWGAIQPVDLNFDSKRAIIVVDNSPFVVELKGKAKVAVDVFLRGVLAGLFSRIFSENIDCVEVECAALNFERCKFIIKPQQEFDFTNQVVKDQIEVGD